jgi:hypothetical protein
VSLARDCQKQDKYIDQYDGPSSLIILSSSPKRKHTKKLPIAKTPNLYDEERKTFYRTFGAKNFFGLKDKIQSGLETCRNISVDKSVKSPQQRYEEFDSVRKNMQEYNLLKTQKRFLSKRERLLKSNWKHGIVGTYNRFT